MKLLRRFLPLLLLGALAVSVRAGPATIDADQIQARLADYQARLQLTPGQQQQLKPIFQESFTWLRNWKQRLDATSSRWDRRSLLREARQHQDKTEKQIEPLLTEAQRKIWQQIRDERRAELKAAYRQKH